MRVRISTLSPSQSGVALRLDNRTTYTRLRFAQAPHSKVVNPAILVLLLLLFVSTLAHAAAPMLDFLFPSGGQQGTTVEVTASGKLDPWPVQVWTDTPGLDFKASTNKGTFTVTIGKNVSYGPHLVRLYNGEGATELKTFVVGRQTELMEKEPNDNVQKAQALEKLPITINGRLDKGADVDSFTFKGEAGKWIVATVDSYSIGAPVDAYLHLLDEHGTQLALGNDSYNLDPFLAYKIEKTGTYTLQISGFVHPPQAEIRFTGGSSTIYRMTVTDGPVIRRAFADKGDKLQASGWNLDALGNATKNGWVLVDKKILVDARVESLLRSPPGSQPELIETEPNNKTNEAQVVSIPCSINGCIQTAGDEDRFAFEVKKNDKFELRLSAIAMSSPLDGTLRIEDATGKQLSRDDVGVNMDDPSLTWTAPADGKYLVAVSDLYRHGGDDYYYRLEMLPQIPAFKGKVDNHAYRLDPGKSTDIKVTVTRLNGHQGKLTVTAEHLPEGVTVKEMDAPEKSGEVKLTLTAPADAKPASGPIQVVIASGDKAVGKHAMYEFRAKDSKTGDFLVTDTDNLWLTVVSTNAAPAAPPEKKKKK